MDKTVAALLSGACLLILALFALKFVVIYYAGWFVVGQLVGVVSSPGWFVVSCCALVWACSPSGSYTSKGD